MRQGVKLILVHNNPYRLISFPSILRLRCYFFDQLIRISKIKIKNHRIDGKTFGKIPPVGWIVIFFGVTFGFLEKLRRWKSFPEIKKCWHVVTHWKEVGFDRFLFVSLWNFSGCVFVNWIPLMTLFRRKSFRINFILKCLSRLPNT